jgi:curved DNA-binding protein CbpA
VGEIRSAYRRLAKLHHPDTAGERSLGRFLAVKAAYEALVDGEGQLRARGGPGRTSTGAARSPSAARGASRDAWRARRASGAEAGAAFGKRDAGGAAEPGSEGGSQTGGRPAGGEGDDGAKRARAAGGPGRGAGSRTRSSERRTAKPGSTTYDEATQPLDPSWDGATWYGASSGSYWTLNPREYADPRKHGPEYQERARRAARLEAQLRGRRTAPPRAEDDGSSETTAEEPPEPPAAS